ncbi:MAG: hypothetical protein ACO1OG_00905 [Devosia sp.]
MNKLLRRHLEINNLMRSTTADNFKQLSQVVDKSADALDDDLVASLGPTAVARWAAMSKAERLKLSKRFVASDLGFKPH